MRNEIQIKPVRKKDIKGVLDLHKESFEMFAAPGKYDEEYGDDLKRSLDRDNTLVAVDGENVVGSVSYSTLGKCSLELLLHSFRILELSSQHDQNVQTALRKLLKWRGPNGESEDIKVNEFIEQGVRRGEEPFPQQVLPYFLPLDSVIGNDLVVAEEWRESGVGTALVKFALEQIVGEEPRRIVISSVFAGSYSNRILKDTGFLPLVSVTPSYPNKDELLFMILDNYGAAFHLERGIVLQCPDIEIQQQQLTFGSKFDAREHEDIYIELKKKPKEIFSPVLTMMVME